MNEITEKPDEELIRNQLETLENSLRKEIQEGRIIEAELPLTHTFTDGVYARTMFLPKGTFVVGKIHKHEHFNFISKGVVDVLTKEGLKRLVGPCQMVSPAGVKRAVHVLEDCEWTTIHANENNERDLSKLEEKIIAKTYLEIDSPNDISKIEDKK